MMIQLSYPSRLKHKEVQDSYNITHNINLIIAWYIFIISKNGVNIFLVLVRGCWKIDLIMLNVKLTLLKGREVSHGFGIIYIKKKNRKNE